MLLLSRRLSKTDSSAGNRSIGGSLVLYWLCMVLAMLAAALLLLSVTGVLSRTARQFGETAALQQSNTAALFTAQMDALAAQGIELSETVGGELERFLARRGLSFDALNDDPALIAELESLMIPTLETAMAGSTCSGVYFCLDATANTTLPESKTSRMGVYLRYSGLRSAHPSGITAYFRGTVDAARKTACSCTTAGIRSWTRPCSPATGRSWRGRVSGSPAAASGRGGCHCRIPGRA